MLSGKSGKIMHVGVALADITRWRLTTTADNTAYASSATGGYQRLIPGVKRGSGSFEFQLDPRQAITQRVHEGDRVTLLLHVDAARFYSVPAVIESLFLSVDIANGDVIGGAAEFETDGAWTEPAW